MDSTGITGITVRGEGEWHARKAGEARGRVWREVHLAVDEATLDVRAVEITGSGVGDAPVPPDLPGRVPGSEPIASVAADGACDTRGCRDAIADGGTDAVIAPRRNAEPWKRDSPGAGARNDALRAIKRLGRTIWRRRSGYRRRSRAVTKANCMKLPGQMLMDRDFDRETAELQVRIAILNRSTVLGIPVTQPVGQPRPPP